MPRTTMKNEGWDGDEADRRAVWAAGLKVGYDRVAQEPMPDRFNELLRQLHDAEERER